MASIGDQFPLDYSMFHNNTVYASNITNIPTTYGGHHPPTNPWHSGAINIPQTASTGTPTVTPFPTSPPNYPGWTGQTIEDVEKAERLKIEIESDLDAGEVNGALVELVEVLRNMDEAVSELEGDEQINQRLRNAIFYIEEAIGEIDKARSTLGS